MEVTGRIKYDIAYGITGVAGLASTIEGAVLRLYNPGAHSVLSGSLHNYGLVLVASSVSLLLKEEIDKSDVWYCSGIPTLICLISEFAQKYNLLAGTYDQKDIVGYGLGGLTALVIGLIINLTEKKKIQTPSN